MNKCEADRLKIRLNNLEFSIPMEAYLIPIKDYSHPGCY